MRPSFISSFRHRCAVVFLFFSFFLSLFSYFFLRLRRYGGAYPLSSHGTDRNFLRNISRWENIFRDPLISTKATAWSLIAGSKPDECVIKRLMAEEGIPSRMERKEREDRAVTPDTRYFPGFMEISAALQTKLILEADARSIVLFSLCSSHCSREYQ